MKRTPRRAVFRFGLILAVGMLGVVLVAGFVFLTSARAEHSQPRGEAIPEVEANSGEPDSMDPAGPQIPSLNQNDPCAMYRQPGFPMSCVPLKVYIKDTTEEVTGDIYCDPPGTLPCNEKKYIKRYVLFDYEAEAVGFLLYMKDFSQFQGMARSSPAQTRINTIEGYNQWFTQKGGSKARQWHKRVFPQGPATVRGPAGFTVNYPGGEERGSNIGFSPVGIGTNDEELPTTSGSRMEVGAEGLETWMITPQEMKKIMADGGTEKAFHWRITTEDGKSYSDHKLNIRLELGAGQPDKDKPGVLTVTPGDGLVSSGPNEQGAFEPSSKTYTLKNTGSSPINYTVSKKEAWLDLSQAQGSLSPKASASLIVSINQSQAKTLKEGVYKDTVTFTNTTNGKGSTSRPAELNVGEEQEWEVKLTGQETDDLGGALMTIKLEEAWKMITVDYGVRFDYTMVARFKIKKEKGVWKYQSGVITAAAPVGYSSNFDPDVFFIKKISCKNCQDVPNMKGQSLPGDVFKKSVELYWPMVVTRIIVTNKLKLQFESKDKSQQGWSDNYFESAEFFDRAHDHKLPLKDGEVTFSVTKKSAAQKYKLDKRKPINISYRYLLKRIR